MQVSQKFTDKPRTYKLKKRKYALCDGVCPPIAFSQQVFQPTSENASCYFENLPLLICYYICRKLKESHKKKVSTILFNLGCVIATMS